MRVYDTKGNQAEKLRPIVVRVPTDLDEALRERAAFEDRGLAQVIRQALRAYLVEPAAPSLSSNGATT